MEKLEGQMLALREEFVAYRSEQKIALKDLQASVDNVNGHIADVLMEVGDAPDHRFREKDRLTLRTRVHKLENDSAAASIAQTALEKANELRGQAWTRGQKLGLFAFAFVGALGVVLRVFGVGG